MPASTSFLYIDRARALRYEQVPLPPRAASTAVAQRPRERRAATRRASRVGPSDEDPSPRPPLTAAERNWLRSEVDRRRREQLERDRVAGRALFRGDPGRRAA